MSEIIIIISAVAFNQLGSRNQNSLFDQARTDEKFETLDGPSWTEAGKTKISESRTDKDRAVRESVTTVLK